MLEKFNNAIEKILKRKLIYDDNAPYFCFNKKITLGDVILESILPSPYKLINDIIEKLKRNVNKIEYHKSDLKTLSDKDWKYYKLIDKLPNELFSLSIIKSNEIEFKNIFGHLPQKNCSMLEIGDENNSYKENVWINADDINNDVYDERFKNLLRHELGHVWTFIFGSLDESFTDGQAPFNNVDLDFSKFNQYQKDVLFHLYNHSLKNLMFDYNYVLKKMSSESSNFELAPIIDNIIEILVVDFFECNLNSTETYLKHIWKSLELNYDFSLNTLNLLKHYKENKLYDGYSTVESVKNPIRRLFLIFAFGTKEQILYFKKACEDEFGKING